MDSIVLAALGALVVVDTVLLIFVIRRLRTPLTGATDAVLAEIKEALEKTEKSVREEIARNRDETSTNSRANREELGHLLKLFQDSLLNNMNSLGQLQKGQLDTFSRNLSELTRAIDQKLEALRNTVQEQLESLYREARESASLDREERRKALNDSAQNLAALTESIGQKLEAMRQTVEGSLARLREDNAEKLEQMRATVDEKLHATLEQRLGDSFRIVSERLEQVHAGLGEMKTLAAGVGDLKKVLSNVKTRGCWGEVQLQTLLEQILTPEQYELNVAVNPGTSDRVEVAVRLPGRDEGSGKPVYLPIDAKFPLQDYERLVDAQDLGDKDGVEAASKALEAQIRSEGKRISKYINPPNTTDFALMFLPIEGLYAEVLRRPGLVNALQREFRVIVMGPTTLAATLNSLQMGFRTLAIEKRSSEVWSVLAAVKTEFGKFGDALNKVQKKLEEANKSLEDATKRSRTVQRKLKEVQELPPEEASKLLSDGEDSAVGEDSPSEPIV